MKPPALRVLLAAAMAAAGALACRAQPAGERAASVAARDPAPLPSAVFTSHRGARVRFDEAVRDRVVVLAFGYVRCTGSCPQTNAKLRDVQRLLGDRVGRDVSILSVSLDPEHDTPEILARQASDVGAGPGWTFLTGAPADVDALRRHFGLYDRLDPSAPRTSHSGLVVVGDAGAGRWLALPALGAPKEIARAALRLASRRTTNATLRAGPAAISAPAPTASSTPTATAY